MMFRLLIALAMIGMTFGHVIPSEQRIIGGRNVSIEDNPWHASISMQSGEGESATYTHLGSGAILGPDLIMTVASAVTDDENGTLLAGPFFVRVGSDEAESGGVLVAVDRIVIHPQFNESRAANDIAIIFLADILDFTDSVGPITLPAGDIDRLPDGTNVTVTGWIPEQTDVRGLQVVEQVIWNQDECADAYRAADGGSDAPSLVANTHVCAGSEAAQGPCPVL